MISRCRALAVVVAIGIGMGACSQGRARTRPLETSPVETGSGTIASERSQLQGRWTLVSLSVTTERGEKADIEATGVMTFDAFGNLNIEYRLTEASRKTLEGLGIKTPGPVLSTSGNVAIDPRARQIRYVAEGAQEKAAFDADLAARRANPFTVDRVRYYQHTPDGLLILATHHADGKDAAVARWKRES